MSQNTFSIQEAVADPGFPGGGATPEGGAPTYYFAIFFAENCMKMKEFGPRGGSTRP